MADFFSHAAGLRAWSPIEGYEGEKGMSKGRVRKRKRVRNGNYSSAETNAANVQDIRPHHPRPV